MLLQGKHARNGNSYVYNPFHRSIYFFNYKNFLQFVEDNKIPVQINAASVMMWPYRFIVKRILAKDIFCVIATDTHSAEERPPLMTPAFAFIEKKYGVDTKNRLLANAQTLKKEIIGEKDEK